MILFLFSLTFLLGSIFLKPYIALNSQTRNFIIILCSTNLFFCLNYLLNVLRLERVFKLENKHIINFGKEIGILTIFYIPHFLLFSTLFFRELYNLEIILVFLIFILEALLIGLVLKEVYDLVFLIESQRDFELNENRKKYINREKKSIHE